MQSPLLTFVHISDSHLGPTRDFSYHGYPAYRYLERAVDLINAFPCQPDFVLHTGDVIDDRSPDSCTLAAEVLGRLHAPLYLVNGNHDARALLRQIVGAPPPANGDPAAPLDYTFEVKGERFLVLDGWTRAVRDPLGQLSAEQLARVRAEATPDGPPLTVMLHYTPFPMGSPWLDEHMPLVNGADLHAALLPARDRLRGVFFGHLHSPCQIVRDGITYTCAPSTVAGYAWRAWDERPHIDPDLPPGYSVVEYFADHVITHQYAFQRL